MVHCKAEWAGAHEMWGLTLASSRGLLGSRSPPCLASRYSTTIRDSVTLSSPSACMQNKLASLQSSSPSLSNATHVALQPAEMRHAANQALRTAWELTDYDRDLGAVIWIVHNTAIKLRKVLRFVGRIHQLVVVLYLQSPLSVTAVLVQKTLMSVKDWENDRHAPSALQAQAKRGERRDCRWQTSWSEYSSRNQ